MILIFFIIPLLWLWLVGIKWNLKEKFLFGSGFFWLIITPMVWVLNRFFGVLVRPEVVWGLVILITIFLLIWRLRGKNKIRLFWPQIKWDWPLIIVLMVYGILHLVFYRFYVTMPEWDGYTNILRIEKMVETGNIDYQYRPFFYTGMTTLAQVTGIDLYQIHVIWMIVLSVMYLILMSILIDENKIKNQLLKLLILFSGLAVPVINMEIDFFRPQSLYLLIFPIIFYLEQKNKNYLAFLVSLIALGYHQFFIFPVIILGLKLFFNLKKSRKIFLLLMGLFLIIIFRDKFVSYLHVNRIFEEIWKVDKWRWWFLDSYQTVPDNVEMGWPGISGAAKYYGYYFGPLILVFGLLIIFNVKKLFKQKYWLVMIGILLIISEVLPRLNVVYLPERFPLLIDIVVLLLIPCLFQKIRINKIFLLGLILIGIFGSVYIAKLKGSFTDRKELLVGEWIKNNTPINSTIYTQQGNYPLVIFFAKRKYIDPGKDFFDGKTILENCDNCYVLYSTRKFDGLRSERSYWKEYNYADANLSNFNLSFEQIYTNDGIIIWKFPEKN